MIWLKHLFYKAAGKLIVKRYFSRQQIAAIESRIRSSESSHMGEIRVVIESGLPVNYWSRGARARAEDLFSLLRVWDTEENSGVMIYILLSSHQLELLADRGIFYKAGADLWQELLDRLSGEIYRGTSLNEALGRILDEITEVLSEYYPAASGDQNELPDHPVIIA
ncbi:MAG: TPM domain-containing protein [Leptospiraceae bacterium]|nr:TPM domain-containing protein [Leptospiraceae bacterium]